MGYTHYWRIEKKITDKNYENTMLLCSELAFKYYKKYGGLSGFSAHVKPGKYSGLKINGSKDDAHEDFSFPEKLKMGFDFCKTARKPYDEVVTACLAIMKHNFKDAIEVSSDGNREEWNDGITLVKEILNINVKNPIIDE